MRVIECEQGSEQWELLRATRPTASQFGRIVTPVKGELSTSCRDYACELVAKQLGVFNERPPSFDMEWGNEYEAAAISRYATDTGYEVERVGFVVPDATDTFGGSPDALVNDREGLLETKCPRAETLIKYHWDGTLPLNYRPQVQGLLLITGCEWCDFFAWHPDIEPFKVRVMPDEAYQMSMLEALTQFLVQLNDLKAKVTAAGTTVIDWGA